ncbi:MAG: outer membrane beta-barrel protein [Bacteroidota bacterium]
MKKIKYLITGVVLFCALGVFAQDEGLTLKLNYSMGIPTGSFKNSIVNNTSWKGFGAELMYHTSNSFAIGMETGSQEFYQKYPRQLYKQSDGSDISAVVSNSIQTVPLLLKAQYNFLPEKAIRPYVALGVGGNIITYNQYAGEFGSDNKTKFGFAARPEAGVYIPFRKYSRAGFSLSAGYNFEPFNYNGIGNLNNISARAGISFPLN